MVPDMIISVIRIYDSRYTSLISFHVSKKKNYWGGFFLVDVAGEGLSQGRVCRREGLSWGGFVAGEDMSQGRVCRGVGLSQGGFVWGGFVAGRVFLGWVCRCTIYNTYI